MGANLAGAGQYAEARLDGLPGDNGKQTGILQYPERRRPRRQPELPRPPRTPRRLVGGKQLQGDTSSTSAISTSRRCSNAKTSQRNSPKLSPTSCKACHGSAWVHGRLSRDAFKSAHRGAMVHGPAKTVFRYSANLWYSLVCPLRGSSNSANRASGGLDWVEPLGNATAQDL
jgi:hypothetical protein